MSIILFNIICPVCQQQHDQAVVCKNCGWIFTSFSSRPDEKMVEKMKNMKEIKLKNLSSIAESESEMVSLIEKINALAPMHKHLKNSYDENEAQIAKYATQRSEILQKNADTPNTKALAKEVGMLEIHKSTLEANLPPDEDIQHKLPAVTFKCHYSEKNKMLEVEVIQVHDLSIHKIIDFSLGVVFSIKPIHHYTEADLIISTKPIREMTNLNLGAKISLELQYLPPLSMVYRQVLHLFHHNLSIFSIE